MTPVEFVSTLKIQTVDAAVSGTLAQLKKPSGRRPRAESVELSSWYGHLSEIDREMLERALREVAGMAAFSFCCVLDGVTAIENSREKGDLELFYVKDETRVRLNDPSKEELHNLLNGLLQSNP